MGVQAVCVFAHGHSRMQMPLKIGKSEMLLNLPDENLKQVILPNEVAPLPNPLKTVEHALENPTGTPSLADLLQSRRPDRIAIVVNDITRPTPYDIMLPPLLRTLEEAGVRPEQVTFVVATGIHRPHTDEENRRIFGADVVNRYRFVNHDCVADDLVTVGRLSDGTDLIINRHVAEADLLITTGLIGLHYFAGYSGGRKSILPGVAAKSLITHNHKKMTDPRASTARYKDNPVHHIMMEAARMVGVDFILNVVTNEKKQVVAVVAGDLEAAWLEGVAVCERMAIVRAEEQADVTICSAGGFPKDLDVYQSQKAMEAADQVTRPGGTIVLVADCSEGYGGEAALERWVREAESLDDIFRRFEAHFELGGHKAYAIARVLREKEVVLVSPQPPELARSLWMRPAATLEEALDYVRQKHGPDFKAYLLPHATLVFPVVG